MIRGKNYIITLVFVLLVMFGCSNSSREGSFTMSEGIPPGISIENAKWTVSVEEVDQVGPPNLPIKPPKAISSWIQVSGTLVNCGTAAIGGVRLQMSVWEKATNRSYPAGSVIERVIKPSESIPLDSGSFLGLGEIRAEKCNLKIEIIESPNHSLNNSLNNSLRNTAKQKTP